MEEVSILLGHRSVRITETYYASWVQPQALCRLRYEGSHRGPWVSARSILRNPASAWASLSAFDLRAPDP